MDVDAVQQRPTDPLLIPADGPRRAAAGAARITGVPAGTRVHGRNEREVGRETEGAGGAGQRDRAVLQWLTQPFQLGRAELWHLVEEEDAAVGQADLAGSRPRPTADEPDITRGVMRRAEGTLAQQRCLRRQQPAHAV